MGQSDVPRRESTGWHRGAMLSPERLPPPRIVISSTPASSEVTAVFNGSANAIASEKQWNALKNGIKVVRYRILEKYCLYSLNRLKVSGFLWILQY